MEEPPRVAHQETRKGCRESSEEGASVNSVASSPGCAEKYSGEQVGGSSTSGSFVSPEVAAGRAPSVDKTASSVDAGRGNDVSGGRGGSARVGERYSKSNSGRGTEGEGESTRCEIPCDVKVGGGNRGFQSVDSSVEVEKLSRTEEEQVIRSKESSASELSSRGTNVSGHVSRLQNPFRSTSHESGEKLVTERRSGRVNGSQRSERREHQPGPLRGDKGSPVKSGKKRSKVFLVTPRIDSLAIRPSMHLNEPFKNLSTDVSSRSTRLGVAKDEARGNLNGIMENTSPSRKIIPGSLNGKHGAEASGREKKGSSSETVPKDRSRLSSSRMAKEGGDFSARGKKRRREETIKNYTPQKRTLKDVSCRKDREFRFGQRKRKGRDVVDYGSTANIRGSRGQPRKGGSWRRRSRRFSDASRRRGRRKRSERTVPDDKGLVATNLDPGHDVQVYIDNSRTLTAATNGGSRSRDEKSELAGGKGRTSHGGVDDSISGNEANRQDSVDKQIEEKFSRISDALKEDTMGSKAVAKGRTTDVTGVDRAYEKEKPPNDAAGAKDKFEEADEAQSYPRIDEISDGKEDAGSILNAKESDNFDSNSDELVIASQQDNPFANNYKSSTPDSELVISPTAGSSIITGQNRATSNMFAPEDTQQVNSFDSNMDESPLNPTLFTTEASELTRALIVIDLFEVATGSITGTPRTRKPDDQPKLFDRLTGLKENIEKAFKKLKPADKLTEIAETTTVMLKESTTPLNATTEASTRITDRMLRPTLKPAEDAAQTLSGGAEFHDEISMDETTFAFETDAPTTRASSRQRGSISRDVESFKARNRLRTSGRRRQRKRKTPFAIEKQNSVGLHEQMASRGNPGDYDGKKRSTRADSAMKFSFEAGNVDVVKRRLGKSSTFSRERRNYLQLLVDDGSKARKRTVDRLPRRYERIERNGDPGGRREASIVAGSHPWFVTTETSEYTVNPNDNPRRVFSSKSSASLDGGKKSRNDATARESRAYPATDGASGRILPPCAKNRHRGIGDQPAKSVVCQAEIDRRGRRLLSVQMLKDGKSEVGQRRAGKDRKKVRDDGDDCAQEDEADEAEDASERRKRAKSLHRKDRGKSKKRDTEKRKKEKGDKKQLLSSSREDDYDYFVPGEQEDDGTFFADRQSDSDENLEGPGENYDGGLGGSSSKETNGNSRISEDDSYDLLNDNTASFDGYDKYPDDSKGENQIRSVDEEKSASGDIRGGKNEGKDFDISLTGRIHLESDSYGRPVSISFNAAPEFFSENSIDGETNVQGDRSPLASSAIDATDALVSGKLDNANYLADVADMGASLSVPLEPIDDRRIAREYYLDTIRARSRNAGYKNDFNGRSKLLHLQKKSVQSSGDPVKGDATSSRRSSSMSTSFRGNLRRSKKESGSSSVARDETRADSSNVDQRDESSNAGERNRVASSSSDEDSKKAISELLDELPRVSLDLSNLPESILASGDLENRDNPAEDVESAATVRESGPCYALNATTQRVDFPELTTVTGKYVGAVARTTLLSIHDLGVKGASNRTTSDRGMETAMETTMAETAASTSTPAATTTPATTTMISSFNETVVEAKLSYPRPEAAFQIAKNASEYKVPGEEGEQSGEKKNMLAVSEFVNKLEKLVSDAGNSSNATGRTLIHLKKFIIVPDNRTLWSLRGFTEPESEQGTSTETVILMGEGTRKRGASVARTEEGSGYPEIERKSRADESNLIKEIISSVIRGDNLKRDASSKSCSGSNDPKSSVAGTMDARPLDDPVESGLKDSVGKEEEEKSSNEMAKASQNVAKSIDDQFPEPSPEHEKKLKKNNEVCQESKSTLKEKREAAKGDAASVNRKEAHASRGRKKEAKHPKRKRRRKRKRKSKKRKAKKESKNKKKGKQTRSRWPFKRNLLMLAEEERNQPGNVDYGAKWRGRDKFEAREGKRRGYGEPQIRGGQDCADPRHPPDADPLKYLESAHCLRFSDLWFVLPCSFPFDVRPFIEITERDDVELFRYSVYQLEEPVTVHAVHLRVYAKRTEPDGSVSWRDLTNGSTVRLGTFDRHYRDAEGTITFTYNDASTSNAEHSLDHVRDRLLVPSTLSGKKPKYSDTEGWSSEYLVVQADKINEEANECDKAGVGFTAFAGQPDRCERVRGTCLRNQPLDYWRHDIEARQSGRAGCYFLSNFARVPSEAIKYNVNGTGSREFLALEYHSPHVSVIDVELGDDYSPPLRPGSHGRLTEVHIDNTAIDYTVITVLITNKGSSPCSYRARITDCPRGLPVSWSNAESASRTISPRRDRKVTLDLYGRLSLNEFSCTVVLLDRHGESVARRGIKVQRMEHCCCVRHCACTCTANARDGLNCRPMLLEHYHAAGFRGPLPAKSVKPPFWSTVVTIVSLVITVLLLLLLFLGFLKWLIGTCVPAASRWGLDDLLEEDKLKEYFEKNLKSRSVVLNQLGQPVHPDTGKKSVRICSRKLEFFLNLTFFFIYPFAISCVCCSKRRRSSRPASSARSKESLATENDPSQAMIRVSTYGDDANSRLEAEDTRYVMDELKKSQESLQNRGGYKMEQSPTEESSSD
ncbi:unnamed protein product [Xylocopa violacea]|uniref:Generative cell specific-1/HAP2 domain-containing protein n=1 Tax=Xylocopa violacea TaxID=135666 RepID=A0ABP1PCU1_XYLVO